MPSVNSLPNELVSFVIDNLDSLGDVASLARTNRRLYHAANPVLYKTAIARGNVWPLAFGARYGVAGTVKNIIAAGADPNFQFDVVNLLPDWEKMTRPRRAAPPPARVPLPPMRQGGVDEDEWDPNDFGIETHEPHSPLSQDSEDDDVVDALYGEVVYPHMYMASWGFDDFDDQPSELDEIYDEDEDEYGYEHHDSMLDDDDADSSTLGYSDRINNEERGPNLVWPPSRTFTALHVAAQGGHDEVIDVLLSHGASIDSFSQRLCRCTRAAGLLNALESPEQESFQPLWTPLHMAICNSRPATAKLLLSRGAKCEMEASNEKAGPRYQSTALHHAAALGQVEIVKHLVEEGYQTDLEVRDLRSLTPLYYAYANNRWDSTVPQLLKLGADINVEIKFYQPYCTITPLGEAVRLGNFDIAQKLIDLGADASHGFIATGAGHRKGLSPLHLGCMRSARKNGPRLALRDIEEDKAAERMSIMKTFIAKGAAIHSTDCNGDTPLISAATNRVLPALRALIQAGADVHARNALGRTVVMQAVIGPSLKPGAHEEEQEPVADQARIVAEILEELFKAGARIGDVDPQGNTVLHVLLGTNEKFSNGRFGYLRILLNRPGADSLLTVKNKDGRTPFQVAFYNKQWTACDIIIRQQPAREAFSAVEIREMFNFTIEPVGCSREIVELVLDLDSNRVILSDTELFEQLTTKCKWTARMLDPVCTAIMAITRRGLPPLSQDACTRLLRCALSALWLEFAYQVIDRGADVNAVEEDGSQTPLNLVIETSFCSHGEPDLRMLQVLLDRGANIHHSPCGGAHSRPLNRAIDTNKANFALLMLEKQSLSTDPRAKGGCYLHHALHFDKHVTSRIIIDKLLLSGADIAELDHDDNYPASVLLQTLIEQPYEVSSLQLTLCTLLKRGLKAGVDINKPNKQGRSIASLLQTLLDNKHARDYVATRLELVNAADGKAIKFLASQRIHKSVKLLTDLEDCPAGHIPAYVP